jgi:hypothetical protein
VDSQNRDEAGRIISLEDHPPVAQLGVATALIRRPTAWCRPEGAHRWHPLALAAQERRVLVTDNVRDFPDVLREWAEEGRPHAGCVILVGVRLDQFGLLVRCIEAAFERVPNQADWLNRVMQVVRQDLSQA